MSNKSAADKFNKQLAKGVDRMVRSAVIATHKKMAFEALSRVTMKTPVDTGRARGNWLISINASSEDVPYEPTPYAPAKRGQVRGFRAGTSTGKKETESPKQRANARINGVERPKIQGIRDFCTVHLTNNVKYIQYIEEGSKTFQPPAAMVKNTLLELQQMFP